MDFSDLKGMFAEVKVRMDGAIDRVRRDMASVRTGRAAVSLLDGVYTADPMLDPAATKYPTITYLQVLERRLKVMDATAISLCMDNKLPIVVFDVRQPGSIRRVVMGDPIGTTVS